MSDLKEIESIMLNGEEYTPGSPGEIPEGLIDPMEIEYGHVTNEASKLITEFYPLNMTINLPDIDNGGNYIKEIEKSSAMDIVTKSWGKVIFPSHLESIPVDFVKDRNLTSVTFGDHLDEIKAEAFRNNKITHIDWGNSTPLVRSGAFQGNNLKSVTIKEHTKLLRNGTLGAYSFADNEITEVNIPEGITSVPKGCFSNNKLTELPNFPSTLTTIGDRAFEGNLLEGPNIVLPSHVRSVGYISFGEQGRNIVFENLPPASVVKRLILPPELRTGGTLSPIESISIINPVNIPKDFINFNQGEMNRFNASYSSDSDWPRIRLAPGSTWVNDYRTGSYSISALAKHYHNGIGSYPLTRWKGEEGYLI